MKFMVLLSGPDEWLVDYIHLLISWEIMGPVDIFKYSEGDSGD